MGPPHSIRSDTRWRERPRKDYVPWKPPRGGFRVSRDYGGGCGAGGRGAALRPGQAGSRASSRQTKAAARSIGRAIEGTEPTTVPKSRPVRSFRRGPRRPPGPSARRAPGSVQRGGPAQAPGGARRADRLRGAGDPARAVHDGGSAPRGAAGNVCRLVPRALHDVFDHPLDDLTTREREALWAAHEAWPAA